VRKGNARWTRRRGGMRLTKREERCRCASCRTVHDAAARARHLPGRASRPWS